MKKVSTQTIVNDVRVAIDEIADNDSELEGLLQDDSEMDSIIESKIVDALTFVYSNADENLLEPDKVIGTGDNGTEVAFGVGKCSLPLDFLRLVYAKFSSWVRAVGGDEVISWVDKRYTMLKNKYSTGTSNRPKVALVQDGKDKMLELYSAGVGVVLAVFPGDANCTLHEGIYHKSPLHLVYQGEGWYVATVDEWEEPVALKTCIVHLVEGKCKLTLADSDDPNEHEYQDTFMVGIITEPSEVDINADKKGDKDYNEVKGYIIPDQVYRAAIYYIAGLTMVTYRDNASAQMFFQEANDLMGLTQSTQVPQQ